MIQFKRFAAGHRIDYADCRVRENRESRTGNCANTDRPPVPAFRQTRASRILRNRADWFALLHIGCTLAACHAALSFSPAWSPLAILLGMHLIAVSHNHLHAPIFRLPTLNRCLDPLLFLLTGIPQIAWRVHHLGNHHRYVWSDGDWSSAFNFKDAVAPYRPVGYRRYQLTYLPRFMFHGIRSILNGRHGRPRRLLAVDMACFAIVHVSLVAIYGPWRCAVVIIPVYACAAMMLGAANYIEHYSCHDDQGNYHAWTFTCGLHNFLTYNSGYHLLHHLNPGLHWSELGKRHAYDDSYCPAHLIETGLFPGYRSGRAFRHWLQANAAHGPAVDAAVRG